MNMQTAYISHPSDYKTSASTSSSSVSAAAVGASSATNKIIDYQRKNGLAPRFIFECAIKLNLKPLTSATAAIIFHRFCREVDSTDAYDEYVRRTFQEYFKFFELNEIRFHSFTS